MTNHELARKMMRRLKQAHCEQDGNNTVLAIGYVTLLFLLIAVIFYVTQFNIAARLLLSSADSAASAAVAVPTEVHDSDGTSFAINESEIRRNAQTYLENSGSFQRHDNLRIESITVDSHAQTVRIRLTASAQPPLSHLLLPEGVPISAEASARMVLTR